MNAICTQIKRWWNNQPKPLAEIYKEQLYKTRVELLNYQEQLEFYTLKVDQLKQKEQRLITKV